MREQGKFKIGQLVVSAHQYDTYAVPRGSVGLVISESIPSWSTQYVTYTVYWFSSRSQGRAGVYDLKPYNV